jgi:hypothetical protein
MTLKPVWETLHPYPEVASGKVTEDSFVVRSEFYDENC